MKFITRSFGHNNIDLDFLKFGDDKDYEQEALIAERSIMTKKKAMIFGENRVQRYIIDSALNDTYFEDYTNPIIYNFNPKALEHYSKVVNTDGGDFFGAKVINARKRDRNQIVLQFWIAKQDRLTGDQVQRVHRDLFSKLNLIFNSWLNMQDERGSETGLYLSGEYEKYYKIFGKVVDKDTFVKDGIWYTEINVSMRAEDTDPYGGSNEIFTALEPDDTDDDDINEDEDEDIDLNLD